MRLMLPLAILSLTLALPAHDAFSQDLRQRAAQIRQEREHSDDDAARQAEREDAQRRTIEKKLRDIVHPVRIESARVRDAFRWWSETTGISLVINWEQMTVDGIDPDVQMSLELDYVPAGQLLALLMQRAAGETQVPLIYETTPWYVQVMTKREANRNTVTRLYDVRDLLVDIPQFTDAPSLDLNDALSNTNSGGSNGSGSSTNIFERDNDRTEERLSKQERGANLADMIAQTIEPSIWMRNGGEYASVRYSRGFLVVKAPMYVQRQIGMPVVGGATSSASRARKSEGNPRANVGRGTAPQRRSNPVSGVSRTRSSPVAGKR